MYEPEAVRKLSILLVDTDIFSRRRIQQALENDFVVEYANSLAEVMQCLEANVPDILISEVLLDQESGLDLCRAIRSISTFQFLPIMFLTSRKALQDKVAGFEAGADDYVVKPFDAPYLVARIKLLSRIKKIERDITP